jgi:hypothetical protein
MSERLFGRLPPGSVTATATTLTLKGKREAEPVRVLEPARPGIPSP